MEHLIQGKVGETYPNVYRRITLGRPVWAEVFDRWKELYKKYANVVNIDKKSFI